MDGRCLRELGGGWSRSPSRRLVRDANVRNHGGIELIVIIFNRIFRRAFGGVDDAVELLNDWMLVFGNRRMALASELLDYYRIGCHKAASERADNGEVDIDEFEYRRH